MAFEIVKKGSSSIAHSPMTVSVTKSGFSLGSDLAKLFEGYAFVEIFLDVDGKRIAFKPSNNKLNGFRLSKSGGRSIGLNSASASKRLSPNKYTGYIEDGMAVANVTEIAKE